MKQIGLVLEGGGMRGAYTAGVLDAFMEKDLSFEYVIGVSAGANNGINYVTKQKERSKRIFLKWSQDKRFIGPYNVLREHSIFGMDFIFNELPNQLDYFDYSAFSKIDGTFIACASNCETGLPAYFDNKAFKPEVFMNKPLRASSSLPILAPAVKIKGERYLDGVLSDPIPIRKSIDDGHPYNVVVLTKEEHVGGKLSLMDHLFITLTKLKYPKMKQTVKLSHGKYIESISYIRALEKEGLVYVFTPKKMDLDNRYCNDLTSLQEAYNHGYDSVIKQWEPFSAWITNIINHSPKTTYTKY